MYLWLACLPQIGWGGTFQWTHFSRPSGAFDAKYLNGQFVRITGAGVDTSPDAVTWSTSATLPGYHQNITYGSGVYVIASQNGLYSSADLINWIQRSYTIARSVAYGNGVFVVDGSRTSPDGINWTPRTLPTGVSFRSVVFDGAKFVAGGNLHYDNDPEHNDLGVIYLSNDGVNWIRTNALGSGVQNRSTTIVRVAIANGRYFAFLQNGGRNYNGFTPLILSSADGASWQEVTPDTALPNASSVAYVGGNYVIGSQDSGTYLFSNDGNSWTLKEMEGSTRVLLNHEGTVYGMGSPEMVQSTTNGLDWSTIQAVPIGPIAGAFGNLLWVTLTSLETFTSNNGDVWQRHRGSLVGYSSYALAFHNGSFVANSGYGSGRLLFSPDGKTWSLRSVPNISGAFNGVVAAGNRLFAINYPSSLGNEQSYASVVASSSDGETWSSTNVAGYVRSIAHGGGVYVAVGEKLSHSTDGISWTHITGSPLPSTAPWVTLYSVAYGNGRFVAVGGGNSGVVLYSMNGADWSSGTAPVNSNGLYKIAFGNGRFVLGTSAGLFSSSDGINWVAEGPSSSISVLDFADGYFLAQSGEGVWRSSMRRASSDLNGDGYPDVVRENPLTGLRRIWSVNGTEIIPSEEIGQLSTEWNLIGTGDFNADYKPDVLFRNASTGEVGVWLMDGTSHGAIQTIATSGLTWRVVALGDFNADGHSDLVWQHSISGSTYIWLMNGTSLQQSVELASLGDGWRILGAADFNSDGTSDFVVRKGDAYSIRLMSGTNLGNSVELPPVDTAYRLVGIDDYNRTGQMVILWDNGGQRHFQWAFSGTTVASITIMTGDEPSNIANCDLDGDGTSDILWRNVATGDYGVWTMVNGTNTGYTSIGTSTSDWFIAGSGDFNKDGGKDILWRNSDTGEFGVRIMDRMVVSTYIPLGTSGPNWFVAGVGDFNADGSSDIIWRNRNTGDFGVWLMDGTTNTGYTAMGSSGPNWVIAGVADFNGDGSSDILWRNDYNGDYGVWMMNGTSNTGYVSIGGSGPNWYVAAVGDYDGDTSPDIVWRHRTSGGFGVSFLNGTTILSYSDLGSAGANWVIAK